MPRTKMIDRPVQRAVYIPESVCNKLDLELYSELEGKVPFGAFNGLMVELIKGWLNERGVVV